MATLGMLFLKAVLDFMYVNYVHKYFGGTLANGAFPLTEISLLRMLESYVLIGVLTTWLASSLYHRPRPSGIALVLYFLVVIVPLLSLYELAGASASFVYAAAGSFAIVIAVTDVLPRVKVPRPGRDLVYLVTTAIVGICAYVYGWLVFTGGLGRLNFDLLSVYEVRSEYVQRLGPFMGYLVPWQANVVNIVILCVALRRKNYWLLGIATLAQLLLFGMTGQKSFLFAPVLAGGTYFIWGKRNFLLYITGGVTLLVIASYLLFLLTGNHLAPSLFVRRLFFVPALNHLIYFDFFSQPGNPYVMLSNSFLAPFIRYPYEMPIPSVIAWAYWGRDFWPNAGYLADAYAHFGFMGMFLFSLLLAFFLRIIDSIGRRLPGQFVAAVVAPPIMALTNSGLFTSLLTHGLILALILLWGVRATEERQIRREATAEDLVTKSENTHSRLRSVAQ